MEPFLKHVHYAGFQNSGQPKKRATISCLCRYIYEILTAQLSYDNQKTWPRMPKKRHFDCISAQNIPMIICFFHLSKYIFGRFRPIDPMSFNTGRFCLGPLMTNRILAKLDPILFQRLSFVFFSSNICFNICPSHSEL